MKEAPKIFKSYFVTVARDEQAQIYYVASSDIPGLKAVATSLADLQQITYDLVPTLLGQNIEPVITFDHF